MDSPHVTREQLEDRKAAVLQDYATVIGHLQEIDFWLEQLDKPEAPTSPPEDPQKGARP